MEGRSSSSRNGQSCFHFTTMIDAHRIIRSGFMFSWWWRRPWFLSCSSLSDFKTQCRMDLLDGCQRSLGVGLAGSEDMVFRNWLFLQTSRYSRWVRSSLTDTGVPGTNYWATLKDLWAVIAKRPGSKPQMGSSLFLSWASVGVSDITVRYRSGFRFR